MENTFEGNISVKAERSLNRGPAWNFWIISFTREAFLSSMSFYDFLVRRTHEKKIWWINNHENWFPKDHNLQSQNEDQAQKATKNVIFGDSARHQKKKIYRDMHSSNRNPFTKSHRGSERRRKSVFKRRWINLHKDLNLCFYKPYETGEAV